MFVLDRLLVAGLRFVLDTVRQVADQEANDQDRLREQLLAAQLRLELGEIDDAEFARIEDEVMVRLRELRQRELEDTRELKPTGVEVSLSDDARWDEGEERR
jgi:hypothetical protein